MELGGKQQISLGPSYVRPPAPLNVSEIVAAASSLEFLSPFSCLVGLNWHHMLMSAS